MPRIALYAGSFDPVTNGHLDVVRQAAKICDRLVLAVGIHPGKAPVFTPQERLDMLAECCKPVARETGCEIGYFTFDDLVVTAAQREGLRGDIRSLMNQRLKALGLGIEVNRVDLTARLPLRAKPTFDQVLASESEAARVVAKARTDAEKYRQHGERERTGVLEGAQAKADELGVKLMTYAGKVDGDADSQIAAVESCIAAIKQGLDFSPMGGCSGCDGYDGCGGGWRHERGPRRARLRGGRSPNAAGAG